MVGKVSLNSISADGIELKRLSVAEYANIVSVFSAK